MSDQPLEACKNLLKAAEFRETCVLLTLDILHERYSIPKDVMAKILIEVRPKANAGQVPLIFTEDDIPPWTDPQT